MKKRNVRKKMTEARLKKEGYKLISYNNPKSLTDEIRKKYLPPSSKLKIVESGKKTPRMKGEGFVKGYNIWRKKVKGVGW